jgi:hypothetical protein
MSRAANDKVEEIVSEAGADPEREPAPFFCECSDADCRRRVRITPQRWDEIHAGPRDFVVTPGHQSLDVERVVESFPGCIVVRKHQVAYES